MKWYEMKWAQKYWGKDAKQKYENYLKSEEWKQKRTTILKKAGYRCRRCGARATEVHHENYKRIFNEKLSDLTAICRSCHQKAHTKKRKPRQKRVSKGKTGWKRKRNSYDHRTRKQKGYSRKRRS